MKALKLSLAAILAASSFAVFAADAPAPAQTTAVVPPAQTSTTTNAPAPNKVVVIDGQEYYCPRGFEVNDCPRLNGERPLPPRHHGMAPHHSRMGMGPGAGMGPGVGAGVGMGPGAGMGPGMGMGPGAGYALNADNFGPGPHHTAHLRPHRGPGLNKVMNTYCPHHQTLLGDCLGDDFEKTFKADFDQLQALKDQVFIKNQILKARVADGDSASAITKYAQDVNNAKKAHREARYALDQKIRAYVQAHFDQGLEQK